MSDYNFKAVVLLCLGWLMAVVGVNYFQTDSFTSVIFFMTAVVALIGGVMYAGYGILISTYNLLKHDKKDKEETKAGIFYNHIKEHLKEMEVENVVMCKICDKTIDEIYENEGTKKG